MKKIFLLISFFNLSFAAEDFWVDDPANCPREWNSVNCGEGFVCGINSETDYPNCALLENLLAPIFSTNSNTNFSSSFSGGYLINCQATNSGGDPFCKNNGNYFCNRDSSCSNQFRDTICTENFFASDANSFSCSENCQSGRLDCEGDATVGSCNIIKNSTSFPVGNNNKYGSTCNAADVICSSGYKDCDGTGNGSGNGCEVQIGVTSFNSAPNNTFDSNCNSTCKSGYYDCNSSGIESGDGCEVRAGVTSYASHSTVNSSCNSVCTGNYIDCNGDLSENENGDGCEVLDGSVCFVDGIEGVINGCSDEVGFCQLPDIPFLTGNDAANSTINPLLWGTQKGSGKIAELKNKYGAGFTIDNDADVGVGTLEPDDSAAMEISSTEKGFLMPRMTAAERDAIANPSVGLLVFNTDAKTFDFFNGQNWTALGGAGDAELVEALLSNSYLLNLEP